MPTPMLGRKRGAPPPKDTEGTVLRLEPSRLSALRPRLLAWYRRNSRRLPWRRDRDPYRVWLSEVMLQQTTTPHAAGYFLEFTRRWPTVGDIAAAPEAEVMAAWAGLGYYARARNLIACARAVAGEHGGVFPNTEAGLCALPGIGAYTAAAVAAIAFDRPANVVDGNVERVMARFYAVEEALPGAKPELKRLAGELVAEDRPGDWAQALMDLGAVVCRPRQPLCDRCPLAGGCAAQSGGDPEAYPRRAPKADRPRRHGEAFVLTCRGMVALERRPPKGLLGGMLGLPTSEWRAGRFEAAPPVVADWRRRGAVEHVFTHFALTLEVWRAEASARAGTYVWLPFEDAAQALPSVFRKALRHALSG